MDEIGSRGEQLFPRMRDPFWNPSGRPVREERLGWRWQQGVGRRGRRLRNSNSAGWQLGVGMGSCSEWQGGKICCETLHSSAFAPDALDAPVHPGSWDSLSPAPVIAPWHPHGLALPRVRTILLLRANPRFALFRLRNSIPLQTLHLPRLSMLPFRQK